MAVRKLAARAAADVPSIRVEGAAAHIDVSARGRQPGDGGCAISSPRPAACRPGEVIVIGFFCYTALLSLHYTASLPGKVLAALLPILLFALAGLETNRTRRVTSIARDWSVPVAVLSGYWQMGLFAGHHFSPWQDTFLGWDRFLLGTVGLRTAIEAVGPVVPSFLEFSYSLLYTIPGVCIAILYVKGARSRIDKFLETFALGTLLAYALLPALPVASPRLAFAGMDLPNVQVFWRGLNVWLLDHLDIGTSVFPSGHVAVAFSSALGFRRALPESRGIFVALLAVALSVYLATIYGRYHYAADGLASIGISIAAWGLCEVRSFDLLAFLSARTVPPAASGN
jgi:membrane-associated phospholipid phosphatase